MKKPSIHKTAFVHERATVIGDVTIVAHASVWPELAIAYAGQIVKLYGH